MKESSELLNELNKTKGIDWSIFWRYTLTTVGVIISAIYVGNLLFGTMGLDVMLDLYAQKDKLSRDVKTMQKQNAALQKEYFELIGLDPDSYKKGFL